MRRLTLFASISALVLAVLPLPPAQAISEVAAGAIPGSYIVVLKDGEPGAVAAEHSRRHNSSVTHVYRHALRGYAARMSEQAAANVARDRRVAYVEQDGVVTASETQTNATWGLDRVDDRNLPLDGSFDHFASGMGVHAYVIDTGIRLTHTEFTGRIGNGYDAVSSGGDASDCNGHGTHVAGTIGGTTYGIAKAVTVHPVRVLNCRGSGTWSGVIAGIDWVTVNHDSPAVANMSLGGGANSSVDTAVRNSVAAGITYAVAGGNDGADACNYSPARVPEALTVGATDKVDTKASWSNFGTCLDLFAPGVSITSAWHKSDTSTNTISGTSMASPHVAGVAAQYLELHPTAQPADVNGELVANGSPNKVLSAGAGSPNVLLHSRYGETVTQPVNTGPTAGSNQSVSVRAGSTIEITLTGSDPDAADCELTFATSDATSGGVLSSITDQQCVSGSLNTDSAAVQYTAPSEGSSDSFTYTVNDGEATSAAATVSVTITSGSNAVPAASFTSSCTDLTCAFTDTSTDSDGTVGAWSWNFGDGTTSTSQHPSRTYLAAGAYTVTLTVTDNDGATATTSASVSVKAPSVISLTATGYKVKGVQHADLSWSGATSDDVDVYRDGVKIATTANAGAHTDRIGSKGGGSYTYKVCEAGTTTCSNDSTVVF